MPHLDNNLTQANPAARKPSVLTFLLFQTFFLFFLMIGYLSSSENSQIINLLLSTYYFQNKTLSGRNLNTTFPTFFSFKFFSI